MGIHESRSTSALVLETNNLRGGGADAARVTSSLERLVRHLAAQSLPLQRLLEVVITHDGLGAAERARIEAAAGVPIWFVLVPEDAGYYEAKNVGFDATTADVVVFGDADCWPDPSWLEQILAPFSRDPGTEVVAGRTTYRDDLLGAAATAIDFMYFASPLGAGCTRNFYANNVAFRRDVFDKHRFRSAEHVYRGHCQRLGIRLAEAGTPIVYEPLAHTIHRLPDDARELVHLRLLRGADTAEMARSFGDAFLPRRARFLGQLGPISALAVLGVRFGSSMRAIGRQGLSEMRGRRRAACAAMMGAISCVDAAGALVRSVGRFDLGARDGGLRRGALSYHQNRDGLFS
jgi:hypothetical protein